MLRKSGCYILKYKINAETNILYMISKTIWKLYFNPKLVKNIMSKMKL